MKPTVETIIRELISELLCVNIEEVVPTASFIDDLGAESLDLIELTFNLEDMFGLDISNEDTKNMKTVGDVITYINFHSKGKTK